MRTSVFAVATLLSLAASVPEAKEPTSEQKVVTAAQVNGVWKTKGGEFKILALGHQQLRVEFSGSWGTGAATHVGEARGIAHIDGTSAVFKPDETENCTLTLEFQGKVMKVSQEEGKALGCGFGMHVYADGTYKKIRAGKPKFTAE